MRIFLDVGANTGQTLKTVLDTRYDFDKVYCFEPAPQCWPHLEKIAHVDPRVAVRKFGLWNQNCQTELYEPGRKGASMWAKSYARDNNAEICEFRGASQWFRENIKPTDTVWLKLNCEGAECGILYDLLDAEWRKVTHALIGFHGRKIGDLATSETALRAVLRDYPSVAYPEDVTLATWLMRTCI